MSKFKKKKKKEGLFSLMPKLNHDKNVCEVTGMGFHPAVAFGFQNWKWTLLLLRLACVSPAGMSFDFE